MFFILKINRYWKYFHVFQVKRKSGFNSANFDFWKSGKKKNKKTQTSHDEKYCARGGCGGVAPFSFIPLFLLDFHHFYGPGQKRVFWGRTLSKNSHWIRTKSGWVPSNRVKMPSTFHFLKTHTQFSRQLKAWCFSMECFSFFLFRVAVCAPRTPTRISDYEFLEQSQNDRKMASFDCLRE